jgi:hypothetical protein
MIRLSKDWLIEPVFDYEYKSYQILAYTAQAQEKFEKSMIFPYLGDIQFHIRNINSYQEAITGLEKEMKTDLIGIDLKRKQLIREDLKEDAVVATLHEVAEFASYKLANIYQRGMEEKEKLKELIHISPVGILGATNTGGLLLLNQARKTRVYKYQYRMVRRPHGNEAYKDVVTQFIGERNVGILPDFQKLKMEYVSGGEYNTYLIECDSSVPVFETVMPITKEYLLEEVC